MFFETEISKWKPATLEVTGCRENGSCIEIPARIGGMPVSSVAKEAFRGRADIEEVILPDGIEMIDVKAFEDCTALRRVRFPESLHFLRTECFQRCGALETAELPAGLERIEDGVFRGCASLAGVSLAGTVTRIGGGAFEGCGSLQRFSYREAPVYVGEDCFRGTPLPEEDASGFVTVRCTANSAPEDASGRAGRILLRYRGDALRVRIPDGVRVLAAGAFARCFAVLSVTAPAGLKSAGDGCFEKCTSLKRFSGTSDVTCVGARAFEDCSALEEIPFFPALEELGEYAFAGCRSLRRLTLPRTVTELPAGVCRGCAGAEQVYFPQGLTAVGPYAFEGCSSLGHLGLPDTVRVIGRSAFAGCGQLLSVDLPSGLETLEEGAFGRCGALLSASVKKWNYYMGRLGEGLHIDLRLIAADGSLQAVVFYSDDWQRFARGGRASLAMALYSAPDIDYDEYDACFDLLLYDEDRAHFALDRLLWPAGLGAETAAKYRGWLREHQTAACAVVIRRNMEQAALMLCREDLLGAEALDAAVELAGEAGASSILMTFLNHKKTVARGSANDVFDDLFRID